MGEATVDGAMDTQEAMDIMEGDTAMVGEEATDEATDEITTNEMTTDEVAMGEVAMGEVAMDEVQMRYFSPLMCAFRVAAIG